MVARLREFSRLIEAEVISNSRNKFTKPPNNFLAHTGTDSLTTP